MREKAFSAAIWVFDNTPESKLGKFKGNQYENIASCNHLTSVPIYARRDDRFSKRTNIVDDNDYTRTAKNTNALTNRDCEEDVGWLPNVPGVSLVFRCFN